MNYKIMIFALSASFFGMGCITSPVYNATKPEPVKEGNGLVFATFEFHSEFRSRKVEQNIRILYHDVLRELSGGSGTPKSSFLVNVRGKVHYVSTREDLMVEAPHSRASITAIDSRISWQSGNIVYTRSRKMPVFVGLPVKKGTITYAGHVVFLDKVENKETSCTVENRMSLEDFKERFAHLQAVQTQELEFRVELAECE